MNKVCRRSLEPKQIDLKRFLARGPKKIEQIFCIASQMGQLYLKQAVNLKNMRVS